MSKKIFSLILVALLAITAFPSVVFASANRSIDSTQINELLHAMEIYMPTDVEIYDAEYYVNRAYYATLLMRLANSNDTYSEADLKNILNFTDIDPASEFADGIGFCVKNGYMNGVGDYMFEPNSRITAEQAIKPLVILLGRGDIAEKKGGYPQGYLTIAKQIGLLDGMNDDLQSTLTRTMASRLMYNALLAESMDIIQVTKGPEGDGLVYRMDSTDNYLYRAFGISIISGVVKGNENTMLDTPNKNAGDNCILVGDTCVQGENLAQYLGYFVTCFVVENEDNSYQNLCTFIDSRRNDVLTISASDLESFDDNTYTYYVKNKQKTKRLPADGDVIFNGKALQSITREHMMPKSGKVTIIDNGEGTVALVTLYNFGLVAYTDETQQKVIMGDGAGALNYGEDKHFYAVLDGEPISMEEIKVGDVLAVASDIMMDMDTPKDGIPDRLDYTNSTVFNIVVSREKLITSPLMAFDEDSVMLGGHTYELEESLKTNMPVMIMGKTYKGALAFDGRLVYLEEAEGVNTYAMMTAVATEGIFDKTLRVRLFTSEGEWLTCEAKGKITIDGYRKTPEEVQTMLNGGDYINETTGSFEPCVVSYKLNKDLSLTAIDTPVKGINETATSMSQGVSIGGTTNVTGNMMWFYNGAMFNPQKTTFFNVPTTNGVVDAKLEDNYSVGSKFMSEKNYASVSEKVYGYNIDELKTTDLIVYQKEYIAGEVVASELKDMIVVDEIMQVYTEDGARWMLTGYLCANDRTQKVEFEAYISNIVAADQLKPGQSQPVPLEIEDIKKADFLRVSVIEVGGKKEIMMIRREFSPSDANALNLASYGSIVVSAPGEKNNQTATALNLGYVYSSNGEVLTLTNETDPSTITNPASASNLYVYAKDGLVSTYILTYDRAKDTLTKSTDFSVISSWKEVGDTSEMPLCVFWTSYQKLRMAMIIE